MSSQLVKRIIGNYATISKKLINPFKREFGALADIYSISNHGAVVYRSRGSSPTWIWNLHLISTPRGTNSSQDRRWRWRRRQRGDAVYTDLSDRQWSPVKFSIYYYFQLLHLLLVMELLLLLLILLLSFLYTAVGPAMVPQKNDSAWLGG